jgi:hypothetical protein
VAGEPKSRWEIADILLRPVGGLLTALSVAFVGFWGSQFLEKRQAEETNVRLYAELMSSRESADSALRKDMFNLAISTFFKKEEFNTEQQLLELELLAYNFHDALDLAPLFKHVERSLQAKRDDPQFAEWNKRLTTVAQEVISKQASVLDDSGILIERHISLGALAEGVVTGIDEKLPTSPTLEMGDLKDGDTTYRFIMETLDFDAAKKSLLVRLRVEGSSSQPLTGNAEMPVVAAAPGATEPAVQTEVLMDATFNVDFFDFPMIDNSRLPDGHRCAVVLLSFEPSSARVGLLYFPGSRASLKDKPFYDEIIDDLVQTRAKLQLEESK